MSSSSSSKEFSAHFKAFFEDCSPAIESDSTVLFDTVLPHFTGSVYPHLYPDKMAGFDPQTLLLDLNPNTYPDLNSLIAREFLIHTRIPSDYHIQNIRILRNPLVWERYHAEKKLRRQLAASRKNAAAREKALRNVIEPISASNEDDPEELYRDEILYHGTQQSHITSILLHGLDPRVTVRANYGQGVYFSDSIEKCMQYVDTQTSMNQEYSIIMCCVLLGRVMVEPYDRSKRNMGPQVKFLPPSFDSVVITEGFKEYIIGTGHYPSSIKDIQRTCNVMVPHDNNYFISQALSEQLRDPTKDERDMLYDIFNVLHGRSKVCDLNIASIREWLFVISDLNNTATIFYVTESEYRQLMIATSNIQMRRTRLDEDDASSKEFQARQAFSIESEIKLIPNGAFLVDLLSKTLPEILQVEKEGHETTALINHIKTQAIHEGGPQFLSSPQVTQVLHPHEVRLAQLEQKYSEFRSLFSDWTEHQFKMGKRVVMELKPAFAKFIEEDKARSIRQRADIENERIRAHTQARKIIKNITELEVQERLERSKVERAQGEKLGYKEDFVIKSVDIDPIQARTWSYIVAELLMPTLMVRQLKPSTISHLNDTSWLNQSWRIRNLQLHATEWWDVAPEAIFGGPIPHHKFWPITPRKRLPNRVFFIFRDYIQWIFDETESRSRHFGQHHNTGGLTGRGGGGEREVTSGSLSTQEQWDQVDPGIMQAVAMLPSRQGLVEFNRNRQQTELDRMGTDLLDDLMIPAEPHMLLEDGVNAGLSSISGGKPECPICQDELIVSISSANTEVTSEKVVKLNSCRHCFHKSCISEWFKSKDAQLKCPMCNVMCTTKAGTGVSRNTLQGRRPLKLGPQPDGSLGYFFDVRLCCYFIYIVMPSHDIPEPTAINPNATRTIPTDVRYAIVPFTSRLGPLLMMRILTLFYYGHLFKVGQSLTRNIDNVVVWNGVHLRTSMLGQFGFPAPNWEYSCWLEINQKGVALGLDTIVVNIPSANGRASRTRSNLEQQHSQGISIPEDIQAEMTADEHAQQLFHQDQTLLFSTS
ncbi:putative E3 ubiquitin-protein ligase dtx2 [Linnemannia zychae]|nr:putative E3 ubiquitin-protein ligase dtx2 [Linnemannia zychae]